MVSSHITYAIVVIGVISAIDVTSMIRFCKGPLFFFFFLCFLKEKNNIHHFVIDVIDVIGVIGMI